MRRLLLVLPLAILGALYGTRTVLPAALERPTVTLGIGGKTQLPYLPVNIAQLRGYFRQEGLTVRFDEFRGGSHSLQALLGGSVDFISGAYEHTLYLQAKGQFINAVALQNNSFGVVIALSKKRAAAYKSPSDLRGLKFGVTAPGSSSALALGLLMAKAGLTTDDISVIGVGTGAAAIAAMKSGELDGEANFDPIITKLTSDGDVVPVIDTRRKEGLEYLYGGRFAGSVISTNADFVKHNPATVQAFVNAMVRALRWLHSASTDEIVEALPPEFQAGDKKAYTMAVEANREMLSPDGIVTPALAAATYRVIASSSEEVRTAHIDLSRTYDSHFAEQANASIR